MIKDKIKHFKSGFTLVEIGMCLLIISILVTLCIPIVTRQIKKTDEYAYYLAFKTVEKLGGQIIAFGDPEGVIPEVTTYNKNFDLKKYIASYSDKVFKSLTPKADAIMKTSEIVSFSSFEYDYMRVCLGNPNVVKDYDEQAGNEVWDLQLDIEARGQGDICKTVYRGGSYTSAINTDFIYKRFMCPNMNKNDVIEMLKTTTKTPEEYCKWLAENCAGAYDCKKTDKKGCFKHVILNQTTNLAEFDECVITVSDPDISYSAPVLGAKSSSTLENAINCSSYGLYGMKNEGVDGRLNCSCDSSHPVFAVNNNNICCPTPEDNKVPYYYNASKACVNCIIGAFNERTGNCCPNHSFYNKALKRCSCYEGYTPNNEDNPTSCAISGASCPAGSHMSNSICVSNASITSAKRLCELINYNWNVSVNNCNTFSEYSASEGNIKYYKELFDAITASNTPYLSAKAVKGAFNNVEPNIIFANGLRMWILGDKAASIAGLSYTPDDYEANLNICYDTGASTESSCTGDNHYFCKNDSHCYTLNAGDSTNEDGSTRLVLQDARNCCSSADFSDLIPLYEGNDYLKDPRTYAINGFTIFIDINGTKDNDDDGGGGTLWKDVFPFFISSNGQVYPAYPLNAAKAGGEKEYDSSSLFQGGNSSALSTDVYYYAIEEKTDASGNKTGRRRKINAYSSIPYARALCFSTNISAYTPYCQNLGSKYRNSQTPVHNFIYSDANPCWKHRCFIKLKNKIKYL